MRTYQVNRPDPAAMDILLKRHPLDNAGAILRLAWCAGLKREELTELTWEQVSFSEHRIELADRHVPLSAEMEEYLRRMCDKWVRVSTYVVFSVRFRKRMQPQAVSRIAREALDEAGQTDVRLIDLRHDYIIRLLAEHDWPYVSRVTGVEMRALQLHFGPYLEQRAAAPMKKREPQIDEFELWKLMQAEKDTPAGLALWLTWQCGLSSKEIVTLTWEQVDLSENVLRLPDRQVPLTAALHRILEERQEIRAVYPEVLISAEARRPIDVARLSRITRAALIRGGMETLSLKDLWLAQTHGGEEQRIAQYVSERGSISRNETMVLLGLTKWAAYGRLSRMVEQGKLVTIGRKYYAPEQVVPQEYQMEAIRQYLETAGFAYRQDLANVLHIEAKQCSRVLRRYVEQGELVRRNQKYYLKDA